MSKIHGISAKILINLIFLFCFFMIKTKTKTKTKTKQFQGRPHSVLNSLLKKEMKKNGPIKKSEFNYQRSKISRTIKETLAVQQKQLLSTFDSKLSTDLDDFSPFITSSQKERNNQDEEYDKILNQELERQQMEREIKRIENEKKQLEEKEKELKQQNALQQKKIIEEKFNLLPEEPSEGGIIIAVVLPNQERIVRKFNESEFGENVYIWISANKCMFQDELYPIQFELSRPFSEPLKKDISLIDQGLKGRILFNVTELS